MIFQAAITHWRNVAPWPQDAQVEQDMVRQSRMGNLLMAMNKL